MMSNFSGKDVKMSRKTFIPPWRPYERVPHVLGRGSRRSLRSGWDSTRRQSHVNKDVGSAPVDDETLQWYGGDHLQPTEASQIAHGRITQRVGLFHNAKNSHVVVNNISSAVRKTSSKQIGRLVAPERYATQAETASDDGQSGRNYQFVAEKSMANQKYPQRQEEFSYRTSVGSERSNHLPQPISNRREHKTSVNPRVAFAVPEPGMDGSARSTHKSSEISTLDGDDSSRFGFSHDDVTMEPRFCSSIGGLAMRQREGMCTPSSRHAIDPVPRKAENDSTFSDLARRILSALPPIYLRDDHHEKYDTVAIRLLNQSIKRGDSISGSSSHIFRSFLDCTGGISTERNQVWEDNACENIFQNDLFDNGNASAVQPITPELEKLFNRTVIEANADAHNELFKFTNNRKHGVSSFMTPSSVGSPPFQSSAPSSNNNHAFLARNGPFFRSECDREQSSSSSACSSDNEENTERYRTWISVDSSAGGSRCL
ncbi:hypothetical protein KIN20_026660 [Parelaphostrongylus tenuis]|uniref:Uncharacterized protein n=1 Tax=Parelaphostrongylus tenuis TaxID=148309 RepID=A0AAD5QYG5_PARTN|nr:hypothetical protein KIN20_026660 [Parelaphostrongylus tenuis]